MKKRKNRSNIIIDLTSLLDVVFILLLIILCNFRNNDYALREDQQEAQKAKADYEALQDTCNTELETLGELGEYVAVISITANYEDDLVTRKIRVKNSDKSSVIPIFPELVRTKTSEGYDKLRDYLESYAASNPKRTVIISLNRDKEDILYRDERSIQTIINQLCNEYDNVKQ